MLQFPGIILASIVILLPGLKSQCVDCNYLWNGKCDTNETGYFCAMGASINEKILKPEDYLTSTPDPFNLYSECVPYPYELSKKRLLLFLVTESWLSADVTP
ncbi:uncharacterized protein LOC117785699 isoform X2 [Drosophila innubila]|uniref:uncharacterized protein LOC117785699 isoform X2 n=1 Tax=Drosophila innubila TaxID=198719 RepID=UPI00148CFBE8|nr:uncharacterized protein LOC117785699 isoform X2 [Drosophila innubila]